MATTYVGSKSAVVASVTSTAMAVTFAINSGDTLVGYFSQDTDAGQVSVSDNINGSWTRTSSGGHVMGGGVGDVCFFYVASAAVAGTGITVTVTSPSSSTIRASYACYRGVPSPVVFQTAVSATLPGGNNAADSGATPVTVPAGNLVFGGLVCLTTGTATAGTGYTLRTTAVGQRATCEDILSSTSGTQDATFTCTAVPTWYCGVATFGLALASTAIPQTRTRLMVPVGRAALR